MSKTALAVDFGGSKVLVGLVAEDASILCSSQNIIQPARQQDVIETALEMCRKLLSGHPDVRPDVIGINVPGLTDSAAGTWIEACFSGISNVPIAQIFSEAFGLPAFAENDINNCALAESVYGVCRGVRDFAWLTISNGCGGALFLNGAVYTGQGFGAGEFGHIPVEYEAPLPCPCGQYGCLEAHASAPAMLQSYERKTGINTGEKGVKQIAEFAMAGEEAAKQVFQETGMYVGRAIAAVTNIVNPPVFVIGGGVSGAWDLFYPELRKTVDRHIYQKPNASLRIVRTGLLYYAALVGAAACAFLRAGASEGK